MINKRFYTIKGYLDFVSGKNISMENVELYITLSKLAKQHQLQSVNDCNGKGYVPRKGYFSFVAEGIYKSAYLTEDCETNIFLEECYKIEEKIRELTKNSIFNVEFQGDPRGYTVKLSFKGDSNRVLEWF